MATAKATITKTPVVTTTFKESKVITLELSEREAETLRHVMALIGGSFETRRADTNAISHALDDAGIAWLRGARSQSLGTAPTIESIGTITFQE